MAANPKLDLGLARIVHLEWEFEMESARPGSMISHAAQSHENCELGRWLHGVGTRVYGDFEAIQELLAAHKDFHDAATRLASACKDGSDIASELQTVRRLSREVIFLLTEMELEALERDQRTPITTPKVRSLFQRLFVGPFHGTPDDRVTLEVSQARLIHLRWEKSLMEAFKHRGRDTILESAEVCALGVWIHSTGLQQFANLPEISMLDSVHKEFHTQANTVLRALRKKQNKRADSSYELTRALSRQVVYLLSVIEYKLLDSEHVRKTDSFMDAPR